MFGGFEGLYAFLTRTIGTRNDSALPTGSLHAKTKDIKDYLTTSVGPLVGRSPFVPGKSITFTNGYFNSSINGGVTVTNVNITGPKTLLGGKIIIVPYNTSDSTTISLKIDGVELLGFYMDAGYTIPSTFSGGSATFNFNNSLFSNPQFTPLFSTWYNAEVDYKRLWLLELPALPINSSFVLSMKNNAGSGSYTETIGWSLITTTM
jgi:hypothetical protein